MRYEADLTVLVYTEFILSLMLHTQIWDLEFCFNVKVFLPYWQTFPVIIICNFWYIVSPLLLKHLCERLWFPYCYRYISYSVLPWLGNIFVDLLKPFVVWWFTSLLIFHMLNFALSHYSLCIGKVLKRKI